MNKNIAALALIILGISLTPSCFAEEPPEPTVEPKHIDPGPPPSDAIILFDGKDLSRWTTKNGEAAKWDVKN
ncbi:MAG: hypothetical protein ACR2H1_13780, partial [Limisphaerales bacterium]